jgi:hypothetical protein
MEGKKTHLHGEKAMAFTLPLSLFHHQQEHGRKKKKNTYMVRKPWHLPCLSLSLSLFSIVLKNSYGFE